MSEISDSKKIAMANAVRRLQDTTARTFKMLRTDRFLADAHWSLAESVCEIQNPYIVGEMYEVSGHANYYTMVYLWRGVIHSKKRDRRHTLSSCIKSVNFIKLHQFCENQT